MDFQTLKHEVLAEAGNTIPLTSDRAGRYVNQSYLEICDRQSWPFLETVASDTHPIDLTDIRQVLTVYDTGQERVIPGAERAFLIDLGYILSDTGDAEYWYFDDHDSLKLYPVSTNSIQVRYIKVPAELSADDDTPVIPARFHDAIVAGAVVRAAHSAGDWERASRAQGLFDRRLTDMTVALLNRSTTPDTQMVRYSIDW